MMDARLNSNQADELLEVVSDLIRSVSAKAKDKVITEDSLLLEELALDSLDLVRVIMLMEDRYGIAIDLDEVSNMKCVADVARTLDRELKSAAGPPPPTPLHPPSTPDRRGGRPQARRVAVFGARRNPRRSVRPTSRDDFHIAFGLTSTRDRWPGLSSSVPGEVEPGRSRHARVDLDFPHREALQAASDFWQYRYIAL
jgi:acyl carrier protein